MKMVIFRSGEIFRLASPTPTLPKSERFGEGEFVEDGMWDEKYS
jgi:hypothetical protein